MEEDANQILWAHIPHLDANERGSKSRCRRWMLEAASYIATRKGGAGIMHWPSHCERGLLCHLDNQVPTPEEGAMENHHEILHRRREHIQDSIILRSPARRRKAQGKHAAARSAVPPPLPHTYHSTRWTYIRTRHS
eukprot:877847-Prymnesium_polylepis.1